MGVARVLLVVAVLAPVGLVPASASPGLSMRVSPGSVKEGEPFLITTTATNYQDNFWANVYVYIEADQGDRFIGQYPAGEWNGEMTMQEHAPWTKDGFPDEVRVRAEYRGEVARATIEVLPAVQRKIILSASKTEVLGYNRDSFNSPSADMDVVFEAEGLAGFKDSAVIVGEHLVENDRPSSGSIGSCTSSELNQRECTASSSFYSDAPSVMRFQARVLADGGEHVLARSEWVEIRLNESAKT